MGKSDLMDRVATDLARGHTYPAIQRMHSLVGTHPADLDLRRRLAAIYRAVGNPIEAGRWSFLEEDAHPDELQAFERAFPDPARRLAALRWPESALPATEFARDRLESLTPGTGSTTPRPAPAPASPGTMAYRLLGYALVCGAGVLFLIGFYSLLETLLA